MRHFFSLVDSLRFCDVIFLSRRNTTTRNLIYGDTILVGVKKFATISYISPRLF